MGSSQQIAWRYYSFASQGRFYHGFYNPVDLNADYLAVFDQPTVDIPASVQLGQTWSRTVTWHGHVLDIFPISYQFTCSAIVDAYGTLDLPGIGGVPALRVHEVHDYESSWLLDPVNSSTNQYYYWLVPGLGVAAQVILLGDNMLYPTANLPYENVVLRMFQSNYFTNQAPPVVLYPTGNLRLHLQSGSAVLDWDVFTNVSSYRVEYLGGLAGTNWQSLGSLTNRTWSDALTTTQRFYRVIGIH